MAKQPDLMDKLISLCKRRGFIFPGSEIYGGLANSWDYGPLGVELKNNIKKLWWKMFVQERADMVGLDAAIFMNPKTWEASGHVNTFNDPLVECKKCKHRHRVDKLIEDESKLPFHETYKKYIKKWSESLIERLKHAKREKQKEGYELQKKIMDINIKLLEEGIDPEDNSNQPEKYNYLQYELEKDISLVSEIAEYKRVTQGGAKEFAKHLIRTGRIGCTNCGEIMFSEPQDFNLMMQLYLGPKKDSGSLVFLRPETAQAIFVDFKQIVDTSRQRVPFGVAQIGKAFRNEITPGNFIFRTREFEQMEIEYFVHPKEWEKHFEHWVEQMKSWANAIGLDQSKVKYVEISDQDRAFYSKRTIDVEYEYPFGQKELWGLAYRTDYDLAQHQKFSNQDLMYKDPVTNEKYLPHVIEPSLGVDRTFLAVLLSAYTESEARSGKDDAVHETEVTLKLPKALAPIKVAVLPLSRKEELIKPAMDILNTLNKHWMCQYDETASIGKRYRRQDEIGTPYCVTIDFDTATDQAVTVRDRDTMEQERVKIDELEKYFREKLGN